MRRQYADPFAVWSLWFAWFPVWIDHTKVWWEPVERKLRMHGHDPVWDYRFPTKDSPNG